MKSRDELVKALESNDHAFDLDLTAEQIARLADYYELVQEHNPLLHLVGPCSAEGFAVRHILESLTLVTHLPPNSKFVDVGAGAGLPSIPCLIVREDLQGTLIESKEKKSKFLSVAISRLGLDERASVVNRQFEETSPGDSELVTCRALDKFGEKLPRLVRWSGQRKLLFFGGTAVGEQMRKLGLSVEEFLMPLSERRFLYIRRKVEA